MTRKKETQKTFLKKKKKKKKKSIDEGFAHMFQGN